MSAINNIRVLKLGGMDTNSAPQFIAPNDWVAAWNWRVTGTTESDEGPGSNPESTALITQSLPSGINKGIGGGSFEDVGLVVYPRFNTEGNNQIVVYNSATKTEQVIYTDKTNSSGLQLLPWNPQNYIKFILVNETYLVWVATGNEVGYTNLNTLTSGGYGTVLPEDLSLLKPQCLIPPTGTYGSDPGQAANYWYGELPVFSVQYVGYDYNYSAWSTHSKRIVPYQQNTPTLGQDVTQNNYIIISVNIGSIRVNTINIARQRNGETVFSIIKSVNYAYVVALPNTSVNVATEIYEAYDPATNLYSFASYGNEVAIPVNPNETDLTYDYIWPANTLGLLNGNIIALADLSVGYARPTTSVTLGAVGYNPNIAIPAGTYANSLKAVSSFPGSSGSGAGGHKRRMTITLGGVPALNDVVIVTTADIRNAQATYQYVNYTIPSGQVGNLAAVVNSVAELLPASSYVLNGDGTYTITFIGLPYYGLQVFAVELYYPGATVANSIPTVLDNTTLEYALSYRDGSPTIVGGRFFPLCTGNNFTVNTPSYAQVNGQAVAVQWQINNAAAPAGAVDYQWMTTKPPVDALIDVISSIVRYKGVWDAHLNMAYPIGGGAPYALGVNSGTTGDVWQITVPSLPTDATFYNLGTGGPYNTGDYLYYVGPQYTVLPKSFGDLTTSGNILAFNLNPLNLYTAEYSDQGVSTVLSYDFSPGDRCTLHYWIGSIGAIGTLNTPVPGTGYTNGTYTGVALTGGTGTGAIATVVVAGGEVTTVTITTAGSGYSSGDVLTGSVTGGTGWSVMVASLALNTNNYFNLPCVNLSVLGYDNGNYIVKVENSAAFTYAGGHIYYNGFQIDDRNIFLRLYSPAQTPQTVSTTLNGTVWYEIGERFPITNGLHTVLNGTIYDGGAYYKTRTYLDALNPYASTPLPVIATDLNYSDFYVSPYNSLNGGRPRAYNDELVQTERKAITITSQQYILGSMINGLTRFYPEDTYGEQDGQTSSSNGAIQQLWQRGDILLIIQQLNIFYAPVNYAYIQLNAEQTSTAISEKLLNNGRYETKFRGLGLAKEAFCFNENWGCMVDPNYGDIFELTVGGVASVTGKMSKYFKQVITLAYQQGYKIVLFYNRYYDEVMCCIETLGGILTFFPFAPNTWNPFNSYVIVPGDVSATPNGSHSTASYNSSTGIVTYTPASNYVGGDTATFTFNPGSGNITLNICLAWTAGSTTVNPFAFTALTNQPLSTVVFSNTISVTGPTIAVAISITGGQYSINGGAYTSSAGTTLPGDTIQVKQTTSGSNSTTTNAVLTIGGTSGTFAVTTLSASAGAYNVQSQYNVNITGLSNGTCTGTPATLNTLTLMNGQQVFAVYTTVGLGTVRITYSGTAAIPGHIHFQLTVNGVVEDTQLVDNSGNQTLTFSSSPSSPTPVVVDVINI